MNRRRFMVTVGCLGGSAGLSAFLPASSLGYPQLAAPPILGQQVPRKPATGPLKVLSSNPRYFTDGSGKAIYLAGSHSWWNLQDNGIRLISAENQDPPPTFDYNANLDFLQSYNHNFFRLWRWETPKWGEDQPRGAIKYCQPHPWARGGPGLARDGKPKFDLTKFDPVYFDRMHGRVAAARDLGFYVSVMLFEGWELEFTDAWTYHPFNGANNVNGVFTEPALDLLLPAKPCTCPPPLGRTSKGYGRRIMGERGMWAPA